MIYSKSCTERRGLGLDLALAEHHPPLQGGVPDVASPQPSSVQHFTHSCNIRSRKLYSLPCWHSNGDGTSNSSLGHDLGNVALRQLFRLIQHQSHTFPACEMRRVLRIGDSHVHHGHTHHRLHEPQR